MRKSIAIILIGCAGCATATGEQKYVNYINDPKYKITQQIKIGEVQATVKWLPPDYRRLKNEMREEDTGGDRADDFYFFDVKFDKVKGDKPAREKLLYLTFDIQNDFVLLEEGDSLMPAICQKIENGTGGSYQYMLGFEKRTPVEKDFTVFYNDKIFGIGTLAFVYNQKDIRKIPKLKPEGLQ